MYVLFQSADTNSDGKISRAEINIVIQQQRPGETIKDADWYKADSNHDNFISFEEFVATGRQV